LPFRPVLSTIEGQCRLSCFGSEWKLLFRARSL
jgi:hypothetical protein